MERLSPRRRTGKAALIFLTIAVVAVGVWYASALRPVSDDPAVVSFTIQAGWGSTEIAKALADADLIRNQVAFHIFAWRNGFSSKLQSGEYLLARNASTREIIATLARGAGITKERTITIIEGWSNREIADYFVAEGVMTAKQFTDTTQRKALWWEEYGFLSSRPRDVDLEGYLFPDTYRVFRDATSEDVIKKMLGNFDSKITQDLRQAIADQDWTIHQIVTLASIIEKEVQTPTDRKLVSDLFRRRITAGMPLQADSTVNYATGQSRPSATAKDLQIDSPYNTYKYQGLPPGPIANPGLDAIEAAAYPTPNDYWYFLTTPSGEVIYSNTHDEHVANKAKYLK